MYKLDYEKSVSNPKFIYKAKNYRITILSDVLIRLEYNENGKFNDFPTLFAINRNFSEPTFTIKEDKKYLIIQNSNFLLEYEKGKPFMSSKFMPDSNLRVSVPNTDKIWYYTHPEVRNLKGSTYSLDGREELPTLEKGLYSEDGFVSFDDSFTPVFDKEGNIKKNTFSQIDIYLFVYKKDFGKCLHSYYNLTGYPTLIPRYALGVWWNKNEDYNERMIYLLINSFKNKKIPLNNMIINNYLNKVFIRDDSIFKSNFIKNSNLSNIRIGCKIDTMKVIAVNNDDKALLGLKTNEFKLNVYNTTHLKFLIDRVYNNLIKSGVDIFLLDRISNDKISNFVETHTLFNLYRNYLDKRPLILTRDFNLASHRYSCCYSGKTIVSWKTLKMLPFLNSTSSNIGLSWWSHDIGGYCDGMEDSELYIRFVQLGVFSPILRLSSESGKYYKREPWKWDVKTETITKQYLLLRNSLIPYIYSEAYKYSSVGNPLIQPIYYKYPLVYDEPKYKNSYFFGSELFISPITDSKDDVMSRVVHRLFLPSGVWYDFLTGKKYNGDKRYVTFYKDEEYPIFAKSGAIIPMNIIDEKNINDYSCPTKLEVNIFPGRSNQYRMYEDDGITQKYLKGYYLITNLTYNYQKDNYNFVLKAKDGKDGVIPAKRNYVFKFRNTRFTNNITVFVDKVASKYTSYFEGNSLIVELENISTLSEINITIKDTNLEIEAYRVINEELSSIISDLKIETLLKEEIAKILFNDIELRKKRLKIRHLRSKGLKPIFIKMFLKLLDYIKEV